MPPNSLTEFFSRFYSDSSLVPILIWNLFRPRFSKTEKIIGRQLIWLFVSNISTNNFTWWSRLWQNWHLGNKRKAFSKYLKLCLTYIKRELVKSLFWKPLIPNKTNRKQITALSGHSRLQRHRQLQNYFNKNIKRQFLHHQTPRPQ